MATTEPESIDTFLANFATPETTTRISLPFVPDSADIAQHFLVIERGDGRTAVVNVIATGNGLSVDVRSYLDGKASDSRLIGFGPGVGTFPPGRFPLCVVVACERS